MNRAAPVHLPSERYKIDGFYRTKGGTGELLEKRREMLIFDQDIFW